MGRPTGFDDVRIGRVSYANGSTGNIRNRGLGPRNGAASPPRVRRILWRPGHSQYLCRGLT